MKINLNVGLDWEKKKNTKEKNMPLIQPCKMFKKKKKKRIFLNSSSALIGVDSS